MASKVQICNAALIKLNANTVTNIDQPTTNEEKKCHAIFDLIADEVMSNGSWTDIIKRAILNESSISPAFGYSHSYIIPADFLHAININERVAKGTIWEREGQFIYCNDPVCKLRYRSKVRETGQWNSHLTTAVIFRLTAELSQILTGKDEATEKWFEKFDDVFKHELASDNQQGSHQMAQDDALIDVRESGDYFEDGF